MKKNEKQNEKKNEKRHDLSNCAFSGGMTYR